MYYYFTKLLQLISNNIIYLYCTCTNLGAFYRSCSSEKVSSEKKEVEGVIKAQKSTSSIGEKAKSSLPDAGRGAAGGECSNTRVSGGYEE